MSVAATSPRPAIWARNHGSIAVASYTSSTVAPARIACCTARSRPSWGRAARWSSSALSASRSAAVRSSGPGAQEKDAPGRSSDLSAFWRASEKERPIAMASPTDFMCVVSVSSAPGNFSNANLGAFTTT